MHAQNLLKVVLKPRRTAADSAAGQSASSGRIAGSASSSTLSRSPSETALDSLAAKGTAAAPKMVCLCAPTTHAGSFRCRLHRASQTQWPAPASSTAGLASKSETAAGAISIPDQEQRTRPHKKRSPMQQRSPSFSPPRSPEGRPSRLSKVVVAAGSEDGVGAGYRKVSASAAEGPVHISKFLSSNGTSSIVSGTMVM